MEEGRGGVIYGEVIVTEEEGIYQNQGTGRGGVESILSDVCK